MYEQPQRARAEPDSSTGAANAGPRAAGLTLAAATALVAALVPGAWAQTTTDSEPPTVAAAFGEADEGQLKDQTLAEMAAGADAIAVVRVQQTDYAKTRSFPSSGWALLKVLVPYRGVEKGELLEVTERGLGDRRCYYPELGTWQFEGDRFFVFLKKSENGSWRGRGPACRLPVLVDESNRFVLRYPVRGLKIEDPEAIEVVQYNDPAAQVDASDFTRAQIRELESDFFATRVLSDDPLAPPDLVYRYTRGISLPNVRRLMRKNPER